MAEDDPTVLASQRDMLERQIEVMVRLIEDLLDVARISTGKLRIRPAPMALRDAIESAVEVSRPMLDHAGVQLVVELPDEPISLTADQVRLAQVFSNLLNNGAKFTKPGGRVTISVERAGSNAIVRVRDTGVGIQPELRNKVFDLFTQVGGDNERTPGGLGIGLALVKRLIELHGGDVTVQSEGKNEGAEFTVRLPIT
jgi:signal transduction histidine kinase